MPKFIFQIRKKLHVFLFIFIKLISKKKIFISITPFLADLYNFYLRRHYVFLKFYYFF